MFGGSNHLLMLFPSSFALIFCPPYLYVGTVLYGTPLSCFLIFLFGLASQCQCWCWTAWRSSSYVRRGSSRFAVGVAVSLSRESGCFISPYVLVCVRNWLSLSGFGGDLSSCSQKKNILSMAKAGHSTSKCHAVSFSSSQSLHVDTVSVAILL